MALTNNRSDRGLGVSREIASSIPSRNVRMRMRTLTSQANHSRSSNMDCMTHPDSRASSAQTRRHAQSASWTEELFRLGRIPPAGLLSPAWNAAQDFSYLAGHLSDQREQRHIQRNDDATDRNA